MSAEAIAVAASMYSGSSSRFTEFGLQDNGESLPLKRSHQVAQIEFVIRLENEMIKVSQTTST